MAEQSLFAVIYGLAYLFAFLYCAWRNEWTAHDLSAIQAIDYFWLVAPHVTLGGLAWVAVSLLLSNDLIAMSSRSRRPVPGRYHLAEQAMARLCAKADMPVPRLAILETPELNAYASGLTESQFTVTLTTGLMAKLSPAELEGVIAHELAHIKHRDVRIAVIAAAVAGGIALVIEGIYFLVWYGFRIAMNDAADGDDDGALSGWGALLLCLPILWIAWLISRMIDLAISRQREFRADAGAAEMTGNPDALVSALAKITEDCDVPLPSGVQAMCICSPARLVNLFSTHPPAEDRIAALRSMRHLAIRLADTPRAQLVRPRQGVAPEGLRARAAFGQRR